ncbi:14383_t:CDS:2, partial [Rhizophagus irregularis]
CNLAKYLEMLISNIVLINSFWPYVLINSNDMEISDSNDENMQDSENSNENLSNSSLSQTISHAAKKELITDIENISYLTLKVFTSIRNIFSAEIEGGYVLITHQCPKNVLYHLDI